MIKIIIKYFWNILKRILPYNIVLIIQKSYRKLRYGKCIGLVKHSQKYRCLLNELEYIISSYPDVKGIVLYPPTVIWNHLYQRAHHLGKAFSKQNYIFFYFTPDANTDSVNGFKKLDNNLYLCGNFPIEIFNYINTDLKKILFLQWVYNEIYTSFIKYDYLIYDYIDDISIFEEKTDRLIVSHNKLIKKADLCLAVSQILYDDIIKINKNSLYVPNGVDYGFFSKPIEESISTDDIDKIRQNYDIIVCYYGALAEWIDYNLLKYVANKINNVGIVLIGNDYDNSISKSEIQKYNNIFWLGYKPYHHLPNYLDKIDVAIIPFVKNRITDTASPIKMYEYIAKGKPVVSTNINECINIPEIFSSKSYDDFVNNIKSAYQNKNESAFQIRLKKFGENSTWDFRLQPIIKLIENKN